MYGNFGKVEILVGKTKRKLMRPIFDLTKYAYLGACKSSASYIDSGKSLIRFKVCMAAHMVRLTWWNFMKNCDFWRGEDLKMSKIASLTRIVPQVWDPSDSSTKSRKSNSLCVSGSFAPKKSWTQICGWTHKIEHSSTTNGWILDVRCLLCVSFYCGVAQ